MYFDINSRFLAIYDKSSVDIYNLEEPGEKAMDHDIDKKRFHKILDV